MIHTIIWYPGCPDKILQEAFFHHLQTLKR
jgi:hypothetical protein